MSDCVIELFQRIEDHISLRGMRVVKYRGTGFAENEFPMVITSTGIEIPSTAAAVRDYPVYTERIETGVASPGYDAGRRLPARQQRVGHRLAGHGQIHPGQALSCWLPASGARAGCTSASTRGRVKLYATWPR